MTTAAARWGRRTRRSPKPRRGKRRREASPAAAADEAVGAAAASAAASSSAASSWSRATRTPGGRRLPSRLLSDARTARCGGRAAAAAAAARGCRCRPPRSSRCAHCCRRWARSSTGRPKLWTPRRRSIASGCPAARSTMWWRAAATTFSATSSTAAAPRCSSAARPSSARARGRRTSPRAWPRCGCSPSAARTRARASARCCCARWSAAPRRRRALRRRVRRPRHGALWRRVGYASDGTLSPKAWSLVLDPFGNSALVMKRLADPAQGLYLDGV